MNRHSGYKKLMSEALFGSLTEEERARLNGHLTQCSKCDQLFMEMKVTLEMTAVHRRPEPSTEFWDTFVDRLEEKMVQPASRPYPQGRLKVWLHDIAGLFSSLIQPVPRWAFQLTVAVVLVSVGILIGKEFPARQTQDQAVAIDGGASQPAFVQPTALETRTRRYIDRSKVLLLGLVNFDANIENPAVLNLPRSSTIARELVDEADGLKEELNEADQLRLRKLVADLEVILLQIANLEADVDLPAIELVRSGVNRRAILLKINVEEMRMERAGAQMSEPAGSPAI